MHGHMNVKISERHDWIPITETEQEQQINLLWEKLCQLLSPKLLLVTDSI